MIRKHLNRRTAALTALILAVLAVGLAACTSSPAKPKGVAAAVDKANTRVNYVPKNDVEGHNYNARQAIADDPATLLWCTAFPTNPNAPIFTIPIAGKLTSGNKRPFPTQQLTLDSNTGDGTYTYNPDLPGADGFYGTSADYQYGFDPAGNYHEFSATLEHYCTTVPDVIQRESTKIDITVKPADYALLDQQAQAALKVCRAADPDPSKPCPAAAKLLYGG